MQIPDNWFQIYCELSFRNSTSKDGKILKTILGSLATTDVDRELKAIRKTFPVSKGFVREERFTADLFADSKGCKMLQFSFIDRN